MIWFDFTIYSIKKKLESTYWENFINTIFEYDKRFAINVNFIGNEVIFSLSSKKDLSILGTKILPFILKPGSSNACRETGRINSYFLKLLQDKNILEIKETEEIKKGRILKRVLLQFYSVFNLRFCLLNLYFVNNQDKTHIAKKLFFKPPTFLLEIDFTHSVKYIDKPVPTYLKLGNILPLFSTEKQEGFLEVEGFPYLTENNYFSLHNFEFDKHTLIVGQTGVGKSKFIALLVKELVKRQLQDQFSIIVIDPHSTLYKDFENVPGFINIDFINTACDLFPPSSEPKIATELTILLFKTLLKDQFNAKIERVLKYSLYILFSTNRMSLASLKKFLTELEYRQKLLNKQQIPENLIYFFDTEFIEIQTKFYELAIMPVLALLDELSFLPVFQKTDSYLLSQIIQNKFLTCFSLNKIFLGDKATRLIAGLLIQQVFLLAQSRTLDKKVILIIDEVSLVENDALISILSEARKFNLSLFLSEQYLAQTSPELLKAILSNAFNYFVFKVAEEDAKVISNNLLLEFPDEILKSIKEKGGKEEDLKIKLLTSLNPRECIVRVYSQGRFYPCFKAKTPDA